MVGYYPLRYPNRKLPDPETGDAEAVPTPEVEIVWNHHEKGGAKTVAVKVLSCFPLRA